jgi:hypothetical protein
MRSIKSVLLCAAATVVTVAGAPAAYADIVENTVAATGSTTITAGGSTTVSFVIRNTNTNPNSAPYVDTQTSCNASDGSRAVVTIKTPVGVTATPSALEFTSCNDSKPVVFSSSTPSNYPIEVTVADSGGGIYYPGPAAFTLVVNPAPVTDLPPAVTVTGVAHEGEYEFGAVPAAGCHIVDDKDGTKDFAAALGPLSGPRAQAGLGNRTATCTYTDAGSNTRTASATYTIVDTTAPVVSVPEDVVAEAEGPGGAVVEYSGASADDLVDGDLQPACVPASGSVFELGDTVVTCSASDAAGNSGSAKFTVTVEDTTAPVVSVPANFAVGNTSGAGALDVTYSGVSASDLVDGDDLDVTCDKASGSFFALGDTTVTCTAVDAAGNKGSNSFVVTVQDRTAPIVTVPANITEEATGPNGAAASWTGVSAEDDVNGPVDVSCDPESGSTFGLGVSTVTCVAKDEAGNQGENEFTVTVQDTTAPTLTVSGNKTAEATSASGAAVSFDAPSATDLVDGGVAASCDRASGSVFPLGTTTVTCTAKDSRDNKAEKTFTVTVTLPWSDVLQPINRDGSSVFKLGSTVPVKFQLGGASAQITDLPARLSFRHMSGATPDAVSEAVSTSSATSGNLFRWDATARQYIFNLNTKGMSKGTYELRIDLGDGLNHTVNIGLR